MIRTMILPVAFALMLTLSACNDSPTATTSTALGPTTIEEIRANTGYATWYETGYASYPDPDNAAQVAEFNQSVATIRANMDSTTHRVVMVIKPTCSCQKTQLYFPRAIKTLDAAGFPRENVEIWVTDAHMNGIDSLKTALGVTVAPSFIVLKDGVKKGSMEDEPAKFSTVDKDLATFFAKP
jgi:hypothetical protein